MEVAVCSYTSQKVDYVFINNILIMQIYIITYIIIALVFVILFLFVYNFGII